MANSYWIWAILTVLVLLLIGTRKSSEAQTPVDPRFGIVEAFWAPEEAAELGIGWERILFYWREIQPSGPDDWNTLHVLEEWIAQANSQGRTIVGLVKNTPPWASEDGSEAGVPKGLYLDIDDPDNQWASFIRRLGLYYGERNIHHWIIWNEPEIQAGVFGHEFAGSARDYFRMVKVAYLVMKEVDPEAVIHLAGLTWWHDQDYLDDLLTIIVNDPESKESNYYFDVVSLHIYFRSETIKTVTEEVTKVLNRHGLEKPIWINETNAPPNRDPDWPVNRKQFEVDLDQQASFVVQAHALGFGAGVERIGIYKLLDIHLAEGEESFGLLRPDFSRRPVFKAYKTTIENLSGFTSVARQQAGDYFMFTFWHPDKVTRLLWARTPSPVTVQVPAFNESAEFITAGGETKSIAAVDDAYVFNLEEATCYGECIIGGPPIFLVEHVDPSVTESAPTSTALEDLNVTPVFLSPTPTPTPTSTRTPRPTRTPTPSPSATPSLENTPTGQSLPTTDLSESIVSVTKESNRSSKISDTASTNQVDENIYTSPSAADNGELENQGTSSSNKLVILALLVIISLVSVIVFKNQRR